MVSCTIWLRIYLTRNGGNGLNGLVLTFIVIVVDDDSHIQRIVLATEETTVTQQSAIDLSDANPARGHEEVPRSTGHIVVTARYSDQQGSKSRQKVMRL